MLLASVAHASMADTKRWPRGDRFYRPPAATPLSLSPNGHFQPPQWPTSVDHGGHWLGLDVSSTGSACGVIRDAIGTRRERWPARKVNMCYETLYFDPPSPALGLIEIYRYYLTSTLLLWEGCGACAPRIILGSHWVRSLRRQRYYFVLSHPNPSQIRSRSGCRETRETQTRDGTPD